MGELGITKEDLTNKTEKLKNLCEGHQPKDQMDPQKQ